MPRRTREVDRGILKLLSDQPVGEGTPSEADGLGFRKYSGVLGTVALQTPGPFTIGVFGEWGTGKTSLLRLIEDFLSTKKNVITVWFNAWRFESEEQPIVPLVATIVREIERNEGFLASLADKGKGLLRALRAVAYGFSAKSKVKIPGFAEIEASFVAKDMIDRAEKIASDPLLDRSIFFEAFQQLSQVRIPEAARVVVMIDDLDRCFPDKAIRLLESIKLVLAQPGFIFFLGVARRIVEGYLQYRYQAEYGIAGSEGCAYLDKIVQLPFHIPSHQNRMPSLWRSVLSRLDESDKESFRSLLPIVGPASGSNPRTVVRFVNNLLVDRAIYRATAGSAVAQEMPIAFFAVSRSLQQRWPDMFRLLSRSDELCSHVASLLSRKLPKGNAAGPSGLREVVDKLKVDEEFHDLLATEDGQRWLTNDSDRSATIDFLRKERLEVRDQPRSAVETYKVKAGTPVDLKITIGYGQVGGSSVLLDGKELVPKELPIETNPLMVRLAESGESLKGKYVICATTVIPTRRETRKTGVTHELSGVIGKSPISLEHEATQDEAFVIFNATLYFQL